jgi:Arc/MetJ-type ribon-helix-helix transcriptional regulator
MKEGQKPVYIPAELYQKVNDRVNSTEFNSVDEYVCFVLEEVVKEEGENEEVFSEEEEQEVKKRLRSLGYLD